MCVVHVCVCGGIVLSCLVLCDVIDVSVCETEQYNHNIWI